MKSKTKEKNIQPNKKTACIYIDIEQIGTLKKIIERRAGISITHVYSEFLRSIKTCSNIVVLKKDSGSELNKKPYSISINSEMADEIDRIYANKFNYSKSFSKYVEDFITLNSEITIWESLKYPALQEAYTRENTLHKNKRKLKKEQI
ncbi:hypothetical protein [Pseudomonas tremae]|uniref:hypothetical protein n=1 Tax=Pseudomonas tremae TaxID=200454 RepID=UPI003531ACBC